MLRSEVNQKVLNLFENPSYLEIGVDNGETFHAVKASRKVAVDPEFKFDVSNKRSEVVSHEREYHILTSDQYFSSVNKMNERFDVIFIDGLHTFDQTLKDLLNAFMCLKDNGIIIVDDVFPTSYAASLPSLELLHRYLASIGSSDSTWMGDVFRLVLFVENYLPLFSYATVKENHGQMIMWHQSRSVNKLQYKSVESISRAEYIETVIQGDHFNFMPMDDILRLLKNRPIR